VFRLKIMKTSFGSIALGMVFVLTTTVFIALGGIKPTVAGNSATQNLSAEVILKKLDDKFRSSSNKEKKKFLNMLIISADSFVREQKYDDAILFYEKALSLRAQIPETKRLKGVWWEVLHRFGGLYLGLKKFKKAEPLIKQSLQEIEGLSGLKGHLTLVNARNYIRILVELNRWDEAIMVSQKFQTWPKEIKR